MATTRANQRWLVGALVVAALGMASTSLLGPLALGWLEYRTSPTTLNQLRGSDLAALVVVAPLALVTALLVHRRHPAGPALATGVGGYGIYTYAQLVIGQEYLRLPGNVERFFPLLLAIFVVSEAIVVLGWRAMPAEPPALPRGLERTIGVVLLAVAVFLVFGQHLRPLLLAWRDPASLTEYASSPTPFWLVKLMDLGIIVPLALATGIGLLRHAGWARRVARALLTGYSCLGLSVAAMALVMLLRGDPDASPGLAAGFAVFAAVFVGLTMWLYRPLTAEAAPARRPAPRSPV